MLKSYIVYTVIMWVVATVSGFLFGYLVVWMAITGGLVFWQSIGRVK